ncbi:MAG TPA: c-type cytochrome [Hanamia sp.]|nr:c-type cytochrome [Hanamia sp.]
MRHPTAIAFETSPKIFGSIIFFLNIYVLFPPLLINIKNNMQKTIAFFTVIFMVLVTAFFTACNSNTSKSQASASENSLKQDSINKVIARGKYLVLHVAVCFHCHSHRDFTKYAGPEIPGTEGGGGEKFDSIELAGMPGTVYAANITPDSSTGIGTWTDKEILRAITQGITKNGDTLFPIMPYYSFNRLAKSDLLSIIAYIRTLKPIKNQVPARQLTTPISKFYSQAALLKSVDGNVRPPVSDKVKYGGYLVTMAGCNDCHTPDGKNMLAGGMKFNAGTFKVTSANLTPDSSSGIGSWSEQAFLDKFIMCRSKQGYNYNPGKENTLMPLVDFSGMTDGDLKAIYAYLRTIKPVKNNVVKFPN